MVEVHPKFRFWCIPKRDNPKLLRLVILKAIVKHTYALINRAQGP